MPPSNLNVPAQGFPYFTPAQHFPAGKALVPQKDNKPVPLLFKPITIRGVEFHNRIWVRMTILYCILI